MDELDYVTRTSSTTRVSSNDFFKLPMKMLGSQVGELVESRNAAYPVGSCVVAYTGWKELAVVDPEAHQGRQGMAMALPKVEMATNLPGDYQGRIFSAL